MLISLDSGVSALDQFQENLDVIGNNIANVDTVGWQERRHAIRRRVQPKPGRQ